MKRVTCFASAAILLVAATTYSQQPPPAAGQKIGLATSLQRGYANIKMNFTQAAEKMSEADYSFKPGSTPEARTFAQVIAHVAQAQFGQCSGVKGVPNPMQGKNLEQELKTKAEVTKALADSFALCDDAVRVDDRRERDAVRQAGSERSDARRGAVRRARARQRDVRHRRRVPALEEHRAALHRARARAADGD